VEGGGEINLTLWKEFRMESNLHPNEGKKAADQRTRKTELLTKKNRIMKKMI